MGRTVLKDFIPQGSANRAGHRLTPLYLTIHNTANPTKGADALMHAKYLKGNTAAKAPVSWHFTVDEERIVQHLPLDENGWHAGDGADGPGNRQSVGIEICENVDGDYAKAEDNAAWLVAELLPKFGLAIFAVVQHNKWSGKDCPRVIRARPNGWTEFLEKVKDYLNPAEAVAILDAGGNPLCEGWLQDGQTVVSVRSLAKALGLGISFDPGGPAVYLRWPGAKQPIS